MATANVATELATASKAEPKQGEETQVYLKRLVTAVNKLPDESWAALSEKSQEWVNAAVVSIEEQKPITIPLGLKAEEPKANGKSKPAAKTAAKKGKAAPEPEPTKGKAKAKGKKAAEAEADEPKGKAKGKKKGPGGKFADTLVVKWKKKLPVNGPRAKYENKVKDGMTVGQLRDNDVMIFRAAKFWRRKGFIDFVSA